MNTSTNDSGPGPSNAPGPAPDGSHNKDNADVSGNPGRNYLGLSVTTSHHSHPNDHNSAPLQPQSGTQQTSMAPMSANGNVNINPISNANASGAQPQSAQSVPATGLQNLNLEQTGSQHQNQAQTQTHNIQAGTSAGAVVGQNAGGPIDPRLLMSHPVPQHPQQQPFRQFSGVSESFQNGQGQSQAQGAQHGGPQLSGSVSNTQNNQAQLQGQGQTYSQDAQYNPQFRNISSGSQNSQGGQMQMQTNMQHANSSHFPGNAQQQVQQFQRHGLIGHGQLQVPQNQMAQFPTTPGFGQMQQNVQQGSQQGFGGQQGFGLMNQDQTQGQHRNQMQMTMGRPVSRASMQNTHNDARRYPTPDSHNTPGSDTNSATFFRNTEWLKANWPSHANNISQNGGFGGQPNVPCDPGMFSNGGALHVPRQRPHNGEPGQQLLQHPQYPGQQFTPNPHLNAFPRSVPLQYNNNPYQARVNELGGAYNIPGVDHLGYFLQPLGWQPNNIPVNAQAAHSDFVNTTALIDVVMSHAHDQLTSAPGQNPAMVLESARYELVRVFDILRHERMQVRQHWELAQQNRPFVYQMLQHTQQQPLIQPQLLPAQNRNRETQASRNRQVDRVQRGPSGRTAGKPLNITNKRRRSEVSDVSDADSDDGDDDTYEPSVGPSAKRGRGSRGGRRGKEKPASSSKGKDKVPVEDEDVDMDEEEEVDEDEEQDNPEPQRNWYKTTGLTEQLDRTDGPLPMMMPTPQNLRAAGLSFDRMNPSAVKGGRDAIERLKRQESIYGKVDERPKKRVRKGRTDPPADSVPISHEMAQSLKSQFPNLPVVNADGSRRN